MATTIAVPKDSFLNSISGDAQLNRFVSDTLLPDEKFTTGCNEDVDKLASFLKEKLNLPSHSVSKTEKGGSLKKLTAIKEKSDLDLVVFLNGFKSMNQFKAELPGIIDKFKEQIEQGFGPNYVKIEYLTKHAVKLKLRMRKDEAFLDADVLPAYNILENKSLMEIYQEISTLGQYERSYYGVSLEPRQTDFVLEIVKSCDPLKNLIRLAKHWKKTHLNVKKTEGKCTPRLPPSYFFELLVIHLWKKAGSPATFSMTKAFRDVMETLKQCGRINVEFKNAFYPENIKDKKQKTDQDKPFVLDPANPFNNVCEPTNTWDQVSEMARLSLLTTIFESVSSSADWK